MLISVKIAPSRSMPKSEIKDRFDNDVNYAFEQEIEKFCATISMLLHVAQRQPSRRQIGRKTSSRKWKQRTESSHAVLLAISICLIVIVTICGFNLRSRNNVSLIIGNVLRVGYGELFAANAECFESLNLIKRVSNLDCWQCAMECLEMEFEKYAKILIVGKHLRRR